MYAYMGEVSLCNVRVKFYLGTGQVNETRATGCLAVLHELQTKQKIISLYQNILKHSTPTKIQIYQNSGFEGKIHYFDLVYEGCSSKLKLLKLNKIIHHCHCHCYITAFHVPVTFKNMYLLVKALCWLEIDVLTRPG